MIWTSLPEDFGASGYQARRREAIEEHFHLLHAAADHPLWLFDYWSRPSLAFRAYLHAYDDHLLKSARELQRVLPYGVILRIVRYLVESYWERYCGWPDLFVYDASSYLFAEVKTSRDKLSQNQRAWIQGNNEMLKLPFELVKIHRSPK